MKTKFYYFIFIFSIIVFLTSIFFFIFNQRDIAFKAIPISVNVTENLGFDLNESALTFGNVFPGGYSERKILFSNDFDFPVLVKLKAKGSVADLISFDESRIVDSRNIIKIPIGIFIPSDAKKGLYEGELIIYVYPA
ncbi:hypothetical protein COU60_04930 [Candidatus Pacearchaeota archaeon CG10_big_fil_rev_8_21_14_0_10_34_76]|nr:MAG: hypothetical protein COU60_04930 [Candidatus Pacearchaeota archaeon CG10_big_fil_rev_8_21_14_0_10_34_76]